MSARAALGWVGGATAVGAALRLWGALDQPATPDELLCLPTALGYLQSGLSVPTMPFHPHLRNLVLAASAELFGPGALGLRGPSLLLGTAAVPLLGALVWTLSGRARAAGLAALLLAADPVAIFFSRQALQEVWTQALALAGALLVARALAGGDARRWRWALPLAGALFGAGIAAKFYVVPVWAAALALAVGVAARQRRWSEALFAAAALGPLAALVYLATWTPWFAQGYSAAEWVDHQRSLFSAMAAHHKDLVNHWRFHQPGRWFFQPLLAWAEVLYGPAGRPLALAVANPLVWLLVLPSAVWVGVRAWAGRRRGRAPEAALLYWFAAAWAPLVLATRPVWLLSAQVVLPFALGLVALAATELAGRVPLRLGRWAVGAWLAAALAVALALYPAAIGKSREVAYLAPLVAHVGDYGPEGWGP